MLQVAFKSNYFALIIQRKSIRDLLPLGTNINLKASSDKCSFGWQLLYDHTVLTWNDTCQMELFLTAEIWNLTFYAFNVKLVFVLFLLQVVKGTGFRFSATEVLLLQFAYSTCTFSAHLSLHTHGKIAK